LVGCATAGDLQQDEPDEQPDTGTSVEETTADEPQPVNCTVAKPLGALATSVGDIIYQNNVVAASATHGASGCVNGLTASWSIDGGCILDITLEADAAGWKLAEAAFAPDAKCGQYWPVDVVGDHVFDPVNSTVALIEVPDADGEAEEVCVQGSSMKLVGRLRFTGPDGNVDVYLEGVGIDGQLKSTRLDGGTCPTAPELCAGLSCGESDYGTSCGACDEGMDCKAGACVESVCPPDGPYGVVQDTTLTDVVLQDCDGNEVAFHDLCGSNAGYVNLFAAW